MNYIFREVLGPRHFDFKFEYIFLDSLVAV